MATSNAVTPVDGNYGQSSVHVKSELTELHTVSEPSLVPGLSPQQQGEYIFSTWYNDKINPRHLLGDLL